METLETRANRRDLLRAGLRERHLIRHLGSKPETFD